MICVLVWNCDGGVLIHDLQRGGISIRCKMHDDARLQTGSDPSTKLTAAHSTQEDNRQLHYLLLSDTPVARSSDKVYCSAVVRYRAYYGQYIERRQIELIYHFRI